MPESNKRQDRGDQPATERSLFNRRHFLKSSTVLAGAAGLSGCSGLLGDDGDEGAIRLGLAVPTSGPPSVYGDGTVNGVELAIQEEFGGEVAGRSVDVITRDTGGAPGTAVPVTEELVTEENVDLLMGGFVSAAGLAMLDVVEREEVPFIPMGTSVDFTGESCNRYTFHHSPNSRHNAASILAGHDEGVFDSLHIHHADFAGEIAMADATERTLENAGVEVAERTQFPPDNQDFSAGISAARSSGADATFVITVPGQVIAFLSQAAEAGLKEEMSLFFPMLSAVVGQTVEPGLLKDVYGSNSFYWRQDGAEEFSETFVNEHGVRPSWWHAGAYEGASEFLSAIENEDGSTDPDGIIDQLEGRSFNYLGSSATWRECDHLSTNDMRLLRGKGPDEREEDADYFDVVATQDSEIATLPCEDKSCEM